MMANLGILLPLHEPPAARTILSPDFSVRPSHQNFIVTGKTPCASLLEKRYTATHQEVVGTPTAATVLVIVYDYGPPLVAGGVQGAKTLRAMDSSAEGFLRLNAPETLVRFRSAPNLNGGGRYSNPQAWINGLVQKPRFLGNSTDPERSCPGGSIWQRGFG